MNGKVCPLLYESTVLPKNAIIIDLSGKEKTDIGIICDKWGILPPIVVISEKSLQGLSVDEENRLVKEVVDRLPRHKEVRAKEIPYPHGKSKDEYIKWNERYRLGFFPLTMLKMLGIIEDYYS